MIDVAASISRRSTALSRTMRAWYSTFAAVGTTSISPPKYSIPPARSRSPRRSSSSRSVTGSITSPRSVSATIAPSTACSASLLHGIWRPASSRSADKTAGDADVIPGRFLPVGVPEQGGRMVGNDNRDPAEPVDLIPQGAERLLGVEQGLRGRAAHGENHRRLHEVDLPHEIGQAGGDLVVLRYAVLGRPALHHVADEHPFARQLDRGEDLGEEFPRLSHERPAGLIFHPARTLAHDHEAGVHRPLAGDGVAAPFAQPTLGAHGHELGDGSERRRLRHWIGAEQIAGWRIVGEAGR